MFSLVCYLTPSNPFLYWSIIKSIKLLSNINFQFLTWFWFQLWFEITWNMKCKKINAEMIDELVIHCKCIRTNEQVSERTMNLSNAGNWILWQMEVDFIEWIIENRRNYTYLVQSTVVEWNLLEAAESIHFDWQLDIYSKSIFFLYSTLSMLYFPIEIPRLSR